MATVNKTSLRSELDALKGRFEALCAAGKTSAERRQKEHTTFPAATASGRQDMDSPSSPGDPPALAATPTAMPRRDQARPPDAPE